LPMKILREVGITVLIAVAVFAVLRLTVQSYTVVMSSMEPSFLQGDCIMVDKVTYHSSGPQRGQVIVFNPPPPNEESRYPFIKRVIGLPGDTVEIMDGKVFVNGTALDEDEYINERPDYTMAPIVVPENEYFVLGDNRNNSSDSHMGWTVPRDNIIGKAWFTYWPPSRWRVTKHYSYPGVPVAEEQEMALSGSPGVQLG
jgi:signal peptidase I